MTLNNLLQPTDSLPATNEGFKTIIDQKFSNQNIPYAPPSFISKGTLNTIAGGVLTLYDSTGGTKVLTYDPDTGVVTILGSLVAQNSSTGTYTDITIAGTSTNLGTLSGGVLGTSLILGGTFNNGVIGTPQITGGTLTNGVISGTVNTISGTASGLTVNTGTISSPNITGTALLAVNAGSAALGANGNLAIQTYGTAGVLAIRVGGTTFYFNPTGTI